MGDVQTIEAAEAHAPAIITPAEMIQHAIQQGSGVEVMERLLALQERHDAFQSRKAFDDAMADLRKTLPRITKSREVDFTGKTGVRTNYRFEDLAEITEALAGPMSDVGLSFRWYTENVQGGVKVTCRITHRAGHFEETSLVGPLDASGNKNPIQAIGSAVSYLQRYTLKAAVGVAASHDDDAQEVGKRADPAPRPQGQQPASKDASRDVYARLSKANRECADIDAFNRLWRARNVNEAFDSLPKDWRQSLVNERTDKAAELEERAAMQDDDGFPFEEGPPADYVPPDFDHVPQQAAE
jgi:hypothetical protein